MEEAQPFGFRNILLHKNQPLGSGSYGAVCKAEGDGLPCAAKIMHATLFTAHDPGAGSYLQKFKEECRLLSLVRHPNIVQYLGTYQDPETNLPVLLMELCDESLTKFLERFPGPLPYHTELSISHDIALALVYLHSNGLIHRDLTGNNILMIAGTRAKVTDFGMSKLAAVNPRMTSLTLCPGNVLYMSPEALDESPTYTDKLDIFSLGVLLVQIMTRQFPNPSDRFQVIDDPRYPDKIRIPVPETERRHNHLQLISDTHPLKPVALQCLKNKERERPSAQEVSVRLSELKGASQYTQSKQQAQTSSEGSREEVDGLRREVRGLQQQNAVQQKPPTQQQDHHKAVEELNLQGQSVKAYDLMFHIVLIGDDGVGKSCILARYSDDLFKSAYTPTIGIDFAFRTLDLEGKRIKLNIWDTPGHDRFRASTTAYYRMAMGVVLVYDITNYKSFDNILKWLADIEKNAPANVQKIVVGNKSDLKHIRAVSEDEGREYTLPHNMPFYETSAKTGDNISMVFEVLAKTILENLPPKSPPPQLTKKETGGCYLS